MTRRVGTTVRGIRTPIIKRGDNLVDIVVDSVLKAMESENFRLHDKDVIGITESLVARAQENYATIDDIAQDVSRKFKGDIALVFPLLSRNRFAMVLKALAMTGKNIYVILNYPADEVGNHLMNIDRMDENGINPYTDVLTEEEYRNIFGDFVPHRFSGVDYVSLYKELNPEKIKIYLANDPRTALKFSKEVLIANIHDRKRTKAILEKSGATNVLTLDDILTEPVTKGHGYNPEYGLLGSNKATETEVKLFPRDCFETAYTIQRILKEKTGKNIEVLIYGDGAFKDPVGKIWELADPVVAPGFTDGLKGTPNELKIKYIADNEFGGMSSEELNAAMINKIKTKDQNPNKSDSLGTTPRQLTDLLGSLCDLTSGSGDKGTPVVLVQGYFDSYIDE
ncbi:MAG: coenzyme F420-0:L-glutamate ligase [Firmicutes bacterium]|nr:coenzyme F420-0:L-glutamate ligase [Bacillota bacterium]MDD4264404.1 coenzyme F420-0:L-glutamate ligase [Bacillota bacterium]MDD4694795.1 coenzyme F420-0:L-glutamate ligase [Bacillota bacterium]